jgi:hypothetical protein
MTLINWNWNAGPNTIQILVLNIYVFFQLLYFKQTKTEQNPAEPNTIQTPDTYVLSQLQYFKQTKTKQNSIFTDLIHEHI